MGKLLFLIAATVGSAAGVPAFAGLMVVPCARLSIRTHMVWIGFMALAVWCLLVLAGWCLLLIFLCTVLA